ncbi:hypothetical protein BAE44_0011248 [Dichanthelium oligosanthes]|uniref:Uncharacterized protein n=1 Tax=Dichanthelium oligosanthes TaxID=888268 RepID=A0A1E5VRI3_9POAL|nr:hypothetical protein BAE44_0011248 [Dichanthelium oligosanthes]
MGAICSTYTTSSCSAYVTDASGTSCRGQMNTALRYVAPSSEQQQAENAAGGAKGLVQGVVTYTVMDDLAVTPMSAVSSITLLNTFAVRDLADLQEKTVQLGYNEAGPHRINLLCSSLLPHCPLADRHATAAALLGAGSVAGSVGTLYASAGRLDDSYLLPGADKAELLRPALVASPAASATSSLLPLPPPPRSSSSCGGWTNSRTFFRCENSGRHGYSYGGDCSSYVTDGGGATCPSCRCPMTAPLQYVSPPASASAAGSGSSGLRVRRSTLAGGSARGCVQGVVTCTVLDDLTVTPMSAISSITLLNAFAVSDLAALQEKTVQLGYREGLAILNASLRSKPSSPMFSSATRAPPVVLQALYVVTRVADLNMGKLGRRFVTL